MKSEPVTAGGDASVYVCLVSEPEKRKQKSLSHNKVTDFN